jgi:hypothetical protein
MKNTVKVFISISILIGSMLFGSASFAASSASYFISAEVIDLGGAIKTSTNYKLISKLRELKLGTLTSASYTYETSFVGLVYGTGSFTTFEAPTITTISPATATNNASYTVIINGTNISSDATAKLIRAGDPFSPINGTSVTVDATGTSMEVTFDLTGVTEGNWNLRVTNVGWHSAYSTLTNAFTVTSAGELRLVGTPYNTPNPFNPKEGPTHIVYKLSKNAAVDLYLFNQKGEIVWQKSFASGENGGKVDNDVTWDGITDFSEDIPTGVYILKMLTRRGGVKELGRVKIAVLRQ